EARSLYTQCAELAILEGFTNIGKLFKAISLAEGIHIKNHASVLKDHNLPIVNNAINLPQMPIEQLLRQFVAKEIEENKVFYPSMIKKIKKQTDTFFKKVAELSLTWAMKTEKAHSKLLSRALQAIVSGKDLEESSFYYCRVCGMVETELESSPICRVCGHENYFYSKI
ncbi:MAG: rubrerythrin family protein, partial [Lentisphaeria bacterium]